MFRSPWAFVEFTAPLRYEPCIQFINVSQRTLHIYFIDGCRVCPLDARYKNRTKQPLVWASSHRGIPFYFCMARNSQVTENKTIHKHLSTLYPVVKMHKNNVADLMTIYKLPINYRKSLATDSWMCYLLITATETLPVTIPIPIPKQSREHARIMKWPVQT